MKNLFLIFAVLAVVFSESMTAQKLMDHQFYLDTIYANDQKNVALFFPDPIRQGITGSENFVFTYNREKEQHLGLLQATPGKESNLLVISTEGSVFSYIVKYSDRLDKLNYFISDSGKIGNEDPGKREELKEDVDLTSDSKDEDVLTDKKICYQNYSSYLLRSKKKIGNIKKRTDKVILSVENIVFKNEELYFVLKIDNRSSIDYDLSLLEVSVENRRRGKKKSMQKLVQEPLYEYDIPVSVGKGKLNRFVIVLPKFSIAEDKIVVVHLKELQGERDVTLKINKKFINNPH